MAPFEKMTTPAQRSLRLSQRISEVLLDGKWIANTNFKSQIEDLTRDQATQKIGTLNTIAALTFHLNYYMAGLLNVLRGGALEIRDKYSFDLPPINSEADWKKLKDEFLANSEAFVKVVADMPDAKLDAPFADEKYGSVLRNIEGVIEHSYYHLGQVSLIKKSVAGSDG